MKCRCAWSRRKVLIDLARLGLLMPVAAPALAQPAKNPRRVALLAVGSRQSSGGWLDTTKQMLTDLGWIEGRDVIYEIRFADGQPDRLPDLARELVSWRPDVILTVFTVAAKAVQRETQTIPIVFASGDPVGSGLVQSLARPGGNATGIATMSADLLSKLLEMLREAVPKMARVGVVANPDEPITLALATELAAAGRSKSVSVEIFKARNMPEIEQALGSMVRDRIDSLIFIPSGHFFAHRVEIAELIRRHRIPTGAFGLGLDTGALLTYSQNIGEGNRLHARYVDRLLRGERAADMPVERAARFDLTVNLKVAKELGLRLPSSLLLRATEVID